MDRYKNVNELNRDFKISKQESEQLFSYLLGLRRIDRIMKQKGGKKEITHTDYEYVFCKIVHASDRDYLLAEEWLKNVAILGEFDDIYCFLYEDCGEKYKDIIEMYGFERGNYIKDEE